MFLQLLDSSTPKIDTPKYQYQIQWILVPLDQLDWPCLQDYLVHFLFLELALLFLMHDGGLRVPLWS